MIKQIVKNNKKYATIIYSEYKPANEVNEILDSNSSIQFLAFTKNKNQIIKPHRANIKKKITNDNNEILIIKKGLVEIYIFDLKKILIKKIKLKTNDIVIFYDCYHALKFLKKTLLLEFKNGPYNRKTDIPKRFDFDLL